MDGDTYLQGTTILTFFEKMEPSRLEVDVKWDSRAHLCNTFFVFFVPCLSILAFKLEKFANINKNNLFFSMGIIKGEIQC